MKETLAVVISFGMTVGMVYVVHGLVEHMVGGALASDRDVIVTLEILAVAVLVACVFTKDMLKTFSDVLTATKGGSEAEKASFTNNIITIFVVIMASMSIYLGFTRIASRLAV